jgi:hypothetical protein
MLFAALMADAVKVRKPSARVRANAPRARGDRMVETLMLPRSKIDGLHPARAARHRAAVHQAATEDPAFKTHDRFGHRVDLVPLLTGRLLASPARN